MTSPSPPQADERAAPLEKPPAIPSPHESSPAAPHRDDADPRTMRALAVVAGTGGAILAAIGFTGSYNTLRHLAESKGFGQFSYAFPIGIDAGILVLLAMDLYLTRKRASLPLLRWMAHGLTAATVAFNAAAPEGPLAADPLAASMHGIIPILFIVAVEAARHYIGRMADLVAGVHTGNPPLSRWLLAPVPTWLIWRRLKMWSLSSYQIVVTRQKEITIYRQMLKKRYGRLRWRFKAPADELLPIKMARFGLSVDEALEIPAREAEAARRRAEEAELREREGEAARVLREAEAELRRVETESRIEAAKIAAQAEKAAAEGRLKAAQAEAENAAQNEVRKSEERLRVQQAEAEAEVQRLRDQTEANRNRAQRQQAEEQVQWEARQRQLLQETEAVESAEAAEARARKTRAEQQTMEAERATAKADREAADERLRVAEIAQQAAEAERNTAEAESARAAADRRRAEDEREAAEARRQAAEAERAAAEAEAEARLTLTERDARRVARMIVKAGNPKAVTLPMIQDELGVSQTTAHERKARALEYLAQQQEDKGSEQAA
ncbi:DUF2637 domain-containing protein [Streptomyces sp. NBC_01549]|uniref:DUF2637 domain-containing protein n=1 Tax=Streptomyces sp. NBC_01549 TaxID=2975874 RepID=UPI00225C1121|nr:DUF2637 domain-containing protein [Streptomyces sp. NBC_01549]MCX4598335.1 DUF2637 domain-containing protein [Streptomyces sp. NBC_01549]